jgi:hypothetical protein
MVRVIFEAAQEEVVEQAAKEKPEQCCVNDVSMDSKGNITDVHF